MQTKTNKNGVKLLAAVMVFAMAFAGIVVVSDDSDAAEYTVPANATDLTEEQIADLSKLKVGNYKLGSETNDLTIGDVSIPAGVNIYVGSGKL